MLKISRPLESYLMLESLTNIRENNNVKNIHIVKLEEGREYSVGRAHDCDIRINDISVSRQHAKIVFSEGKLFIKDEESKFGTLVLLSENTKLKGNESYQIGRTFLQVEMKNLNDFEFEVANL